MSLKATKMFSIGDQVIATWKENSDISFCGKVVHVKRFANCYMYMISNSHSNYLVSVSTAKYDVTENV